MLGSLSIQRSGLLHHEIRLYSYFNQSLLQIKQQDFKMSCYLGVLVSH